MKKKKKMSVKSEKSKNLRFLNNNNKKKKNENERFSGFIQMPTRVYFTVILFYTKINIH